MECWYVCMCGDVCCDICCDLSELCYIQIVTFKLCYIQVVWVIQGVCIIQGVWG